MNKEIVCYPIFDENKIVEWFAIVNDDPIGCSSFKKLRLEILKIMPNAILKQSSVSLSFGEKIDLVIKYKNEKV